MTPDLNSLPASELRVKVAERRPVEWERLAQCPFCNEGDFDLIGLKHHFNAGHCNSFNKTPPHASDASRS
jgi:hypothetical protein